MTFTINQTTDFAEWLAGLSDAKAKQAIALRLVRFEAGLFGDVKPVGGKVMEARIDVGPGYRLYYVRTGKTVLVMLCGGDKRRQRADIVRAIALAKGLAK